MIQYITLFHLFWPLNPLIFFFLIWHICICRQWEFLAHRPRVSPRQLWARPIRFCPLGGPSSTPYRSRSPAPPWWLGDQWSSPRQVNRCPLLGPWSSPTLVNINHRGPQWWSPKPTSTHRPYQGVWPITADSSDQLSQLSNFVTIVINSQFDWLFYYYSPLFDWLLSMITHSRIFDWMYQCNMQPKGCLTALWLPVL